MVLQNLIALNSWLLLAHKQGRNFQVSCAIAGVVPVSEKKHRNLTISSMGFSAPIALKFPEKRPRTRYQTSKEIRNVLFDDGGKGDIKAKAKDTDDDDSDNGPLLMNDEERKELRRKIREVINLNPDVEEEDPVKRRKKMQKLLADYPLVVEEEDPNWPEDAEGRGFNLSQFFDKITIKNVRKEDDEDYDSDKELVWQDDNYIRPVKDITAKEWEETVFKDISPLIILVHNRYKRPHQNESARDELEKAVHIFWDSRLPSPRCVAIDAVVEFDLASALEISTFPEILFTKAGKILYREKVVRTADDWSKIMAFFYYGAARPSCLNEKAGDSQEEIPSIA